MSKISKGVFAAVFTAALVAGAGAASAGEVTGNGKLKVVHANSECAFSGLEDYDGLDADGDGRVDVTPGTVQNWGSIPHEIRATFGFTPGQACNGHLAGIK